MVNYKNLGEEFIVSAKVHMDETTPHMHIVFVPVVHKLDKKSGKQVSKIACSEYWKGKDSYKKLQDSFYNHVTEKGFNLERGKSSEVEHLSLDTFKQITNYERIKEELKISPIKELETENMDLIIDQNKQLIKYTKKLKGYLLKSYMAIEEVSKLKQENHKLKEENKNLKEKNQNLTNYIEKAFEVVKYLFNFPIERFKKLVDNFVENINKYCN